MPPDMQSVARSSNVSEVGFEDGVLYVTFNSGSTYAVSGMTESDYQEILASPSPGSWYHQNVRSAGRSVRKV